MTSYAPKPVYPISAFKLRKITATKAPTPKKANTVDNLTEQQQTSLTATAESAMAALCEMVEELTAAREAEENDEDDSARRVEEAEDAIHSDPLSLEYRSGWTTGTDFEAEQFRLLLTTGGPAVQIVGDLNQYGEPDTDSLVLQVQDWGTPWVDARRLGVSDRVTLEAYVQTLHIYAGEC